MTGKIDKREFSNKNKKKLLANLINPFTTVIFNALGMYYKASKAVINATVVHGVVFVNGSHFQGASTFSITTLSITTLSTMTLSIMTLSIRHSA